MAKTMLADRESSVPSAEVSDEPTLSESHSEKLPGNIPGRVAPMVFPTVRPLNWRDHTYKDTPELLAHHPFGYYEIKREEGYGEWPWVVRPFLSSGSNFRTLADAKSEAEADYIGRVLSALDIAPSEATPSPNRTEGVRCVRIREFPHEHWKVENGRRALVP